MWRSKKLKFYLATALLILTSGILLIPRPHLAAQTPDITRQVRIFVISDEELVVCQELCKKGVAVSLSGIGIFRSFRLRMTA